MEYYSNILHKESQYQAQFIIVSIPITPNRTNYDLKQWLVFTRKIIWVHYQEHNEGFSWVLSLVNHLYELIPEMFFYLGCR